jgi:hypothetical protein
LPFGVSGDKGSPEAPPIGTYGVNLMNEVPLSTYERAIKETHGAESRLLGREHVDAPFEGERGWQGDVLVFELLDHPRASRCYAWEIEGEVTAMLGGGTVDSAIAAVRAFILATDFVAKSKRKRR